MSRKKSSFYHARWHRVGLNAERAAEVLGVSVETIGQWDAIGHELAERFLLLWDNKHINAPGWHGWTFSQGVLVHKRKRYRPETIIDSIRALEQITTLEREIKDLSTIKGFVKRKVKRWRRRAAPLLRR